MWSHGYCVWTEPQPKQTHQRVTELPWDEWNMWISVRSILFTFSSHPEAPETAKSERQPSTYTTRWVFHGEAILLLLLFPFMPTATLSRRASKRVGVHRDSDINKPASKTVQILSVTLHLLPVVLTVRACTFCFRGHNRSLMRGFWSEPAPM